MGMHDISVLRTLEAEKGGREGYDVDSEFVFIMRNLRQPRNSSYQRITKYHRQYKANECHKPARAAERAHNAQNDENTFLVSQWNV